MCDFNFISFSTTTCTSVDMGTSVKDNTWRACYLVAAIIQPEFQKCLNFFYPQSKEMLNHTRQYFTHNRK